MTGMQLVLAVSMLSGTASGLLASVPGSPWDDSPAMLPGEGTSKMSCKNAHAPENAVLTKRRAATPKLKQALESLDSLDGECGVPVPWGGGLFPQARRAAAQRHLCTRAMTGKLRSAMKSLVHPTDGLYGQLWKDKAFPLSSASLRNASAPHGYAGALRRQQKVAAKLLLEENFRVVVMGGSMPKGENCTTKWPRRLEELLHELQYKVTVKNLAERATTSEYALHHLHENMRDIERADLVILDYSINDDASSRYDRGGGIMNGPGAVRETFTELVALLSALPSAPAILTVLSSHSDSGLCEDRPGLKCGSCEADVDEFLQWRPAKSLQIPVLFYPAAVCASGSLHWLDTAGQPLLGNHPAPVTHDLVARTVLGSLLVRAEDVCDRGFTGADFPPMPVPPEALCVTQKPLTYVNKKSPGPGGLEPLAHDANWFQKDGSWHTSDYGPPGEIVFAIETMVGWVHLEYAGSWRSNMGGADIYLDSDKSASCRLDSLVNVHNSQTMYETIKIGAAGKHTLHIRSNGNYFELTGLYSC